MSIGNIGWVMTLQTHHNETFGWIIDNNLLTKHRHITNNRLMQMQ